MINGVTEIALTKLDVLSGLKEIKVCTSYDIDGKKTTEFPLEPVRLNKVKPVYETLPGWDEDITSARKIEDLPENAQKYVKYLEEKLHVPIKIISVGPKRADTILPS